MSLEAARKVLTEVKRETLNEKTKEEVEQFLKENGYDCSIDELKKAYILAENLSEEEMAKVIGGTDNECPNAAKENNGELGRYADGDGSCAADYYLEACSDTVEKDSFCWSGDYDCFFSGRRYTVHCLSSLKEAGSPTGGGCFGIATP